MVMLVMMSLVLGKGITWPSSDCLFPTFLRLPKKPWQIMPGGTGAGMSKLGLSLS